jgi:hypothetical protein
MASKPKTTKPRRRRGRIEPADRFNELRFAFEQERMARNYTEAALKVHALNRMIVYKQGNAEISVLVENVRYGRIGVFNAASGKRYALDPRRIIAVL